MTSHKATNIVAEPASTCTIAECDSKTTTTNCLCERHQNSYRTIYSRDTLEQTHKKPYFDIPVKKDEGIDYYHHMQCVYEFAKKHIEDKRTRLAPTEDKIIINDLGEFVINDENITNKDYLNKYYLSYSRIHELVELLPAWIKFPCKVQSNSGIICWLWSVVILLGEHMKNLLISGLHYSTRDTEQLTLVNLKSERLGEGDTPFLSFSKTVYFNKVTESIQDDASSLYFGEPSNYFLVCPRCESYPAYFYKDNPTGLDVVLCKGDCGNVAASGTIKNTTELCSIDISCSEEIPIYVVSTLDQPDNSPEHYFIRCVEEMPFPCGNPYKRHIDGCLFYYSEAKLAEQIKLYESLVSSLKRLRNAIIFSGFNYKTRTDLSIGMFNHIDPELCTYYWIYCSVEKRFLYESVEKPHAPSNEIRCICHGDPTNEVPCCVNCECVEELKVPIVDIKVECTHTSSYHSFYNEYNSRSGRFKRTKPIFNEPVCKKQKIN